MRDSVGGQKSRIVDTAGHTVLADGEVTILEDGTITVYFEDSEASDQITKSVKLGLGMIPQATKTCLRDYLDTIDLEVRERAFTEISQGVDGWTVPPLLYEAWGDLNPDDLTAARVYQYGAERHPRWRTLLIKWFGAAHCSEDAQAKRLALTWMRERVFMRRVFRNYVPGSYERLLTGKHWKRETAAAVRRLEAGLVFIRDARGSMHGDRDVEQSWLEVLSLAVDKYIGFVKTKNLIVQSKGKRTGVALPMHLPPDTDGDEL